MHVLQRLGNLRKYRPTVKKGNRVRLRCRICHQNTAYYCMQCSNLRNEEIYACCNPNNDSKKKCFEVHMNTVITKDDGVVVK